MWRMKPWRLASHAHKLLVLFTQLLYSEEIPDKTAISGCELDEGKYLNTVHAPGGTQSKLCECRPLGTNLRLKRRAGNRLGRSAMMHTDCFITRR